MPMILVTPLSAVEASIRHYKPSHLVSLLSPDHMIQTPYGVLPERHLRLALDDVADRWMSECAPCADHVESLIAFGRGWTAEAPMLVHCWAGVSRSMAAAFVLLCDRHGPGHETDIARALRWRAPHAYPNPLIVRFADEMLHRNGRMTAAAEAIGRGTIVVEGERVELPLALDMLVET
jgi:predicted protein tyrosine phosphatase